jgi:hypothetical protein
MLGSLLAGSASDPLAALPANLDVHLIEDTVSVPVEAKRRGFHESIWPEAVADLARAGTSVCRTSAKGRIIRPPDRPPILEGLVRGAINMYLTTSVPMHWDLGRASRGIAFEHRGHRVSVIALNYAHAHRFPYLSTNTALHELLHFVIGDTTGVKPQGWWSSVRELRVDALATRLHYS